MKTHQPSLRTRGAVIHLVPGAGGGGAANPARPFKSPAGDRRWIGAERHRARRVGRFETARRHGDGRGEGPREPRRCWSRDASPGRLLASGIVFVAVALLGSGSRAEGPGKARAPGRDQRALDRVRTPPLGLPPVHVPEDNPVSVDKISLGRRLFFDRRLSLNGTMSCAMCHVPEQGFTSNELSTPIGVNGRSVRRNAPTILNAAYAVHVFHDGRERSLEGQAVAPLLARDEMANPSAGALIARIERLPDYDGLFERAFGAGPTLDRIGKAIASWERTVLAGASPFDRWRHGGVDDALTEVQRRGFELFAGKAGCANCHLVGAESSLFTDHSFHDTGIGYLQEGVARGRDTPVLVEIAPQVVVEVERDIVQRVGQPRPADQGRFEVSGDARDRWRFRTPSLRNVAATAPYMHDGSLSTLEAVVRYYNRGGAPHPGLDALIQPLGLDDAEVDSLTAFLRSLTASNLEELREDARSVAIGN